MWPAFSSRRREAEVSMRRPEGGERRIEFVATANVRPGRHIAVVRDLAHQEALEEQLRQAQKMEAVGRLAGGIAHDFNNLLTVISRLQRACCSTSLERAIRAARAREEIRKAGGRAAALTRQLLAFSRRQVLQPRVLDLNAVVVGHGEDAPPADRRGRRAARRSSTPDARRACRPIPGRSSR